jgi:hypothetical protein
MLLKNQHMLPVVVLLLGILLSACYRTTDAELIRELNASAGTPIASLNTQINVNGLRDGDCFNSPQVLDDMTVEWETIQLVPCNGWCGYRIIGSFKVSADGEYPGEWYFTGEAARYCDYRYDIFLYPLPETWTLGDRTVQCIEER